MSNTARVMSLRVCTNNLCGLSSKERVTVIRCGVKKEGYNYNNQSNKLYGENKVIMVNSSDNSLVSPLKVVSVSSVSAAAIESPEYYSVTRAYNKNKHSFLMLLLLLVKKALITFKLLHISLKKTQFQTLFEKVIIDCRFFTLFAVAGSLLGSVLCFVEGCFIIVQSYMQYFHTLSHKADQGHVMHLLIEAIDMYLVGTALLIFGVGLYSMFVGSKSLKGKETWLARSNLFGLFYMKKVPAWVELKSICHAKSKLGHAVVMILQVGVLDKFQSIPMVTPLDLACFAGTLLISSACVFLLSKLSLGNAKTT